MKMRKLISALLATLMLASAVQISVFAEEQTLSNPIIGDALVGVPTEDATTHFDYLASLDAKVVETLDVDENVKAEVYNNNFDSLTVSDAFAGVDGKSTAMVYANPVTGLENDKCISSNNYKNTVLYKDTAGYDTTFWTGGHNGDYLRINIQLKPNVWLCQRGTKLSEEGNNRAIGIYIADSMPGTDMTKFTRLAYVDLYADYGINLNDNTIGHYWRIVTTYNNVKVYVSDSDNLDNAKPVIDLNLPDNAASSTSVLSFGVGDRKVYVDDVVINKIGTTPTSSGDEGKTLVIDEDFDSTVSYPENSTRVYSSANSKLQITQNTTCVLKEAVSGDYSAEFWVSGSNPMWDRTAIQIRDGYTLHFRGTRTQDSDATTKESYIVALSNTFNVYDYAFLAQSANTNAYNGLYTKIQLTGKNIKVWVVPTADFNNEYTDEYLKINYDIPDDVSISGASDFAVAIKDATVCVDSLKIDCAGFTYENDYDDNSHVSQLTSDRLVADSTTGNILYHRNNVTESNYKTDNLFTAPENYEMTFYSLNENSNWSKEKVFLKNNIWIGAWGKSTSISDDSTGTMRIYLADGDTKLASYDLTDPTVNPFGGCYYKVVFRGSKVVVYLSATSDFADAVKIFDYTFDAEIETTNSLIRVYNSNTKASYDDFKIYDIDNPDITKIGSVYKQLVINGTSMVLNSVDNDVATQLASYSGLKENALYRISVSKKEDKIIVYVDGVNVMECESGWAGLNYYSGTYVPTVENGVALPSVPTVGDINCDENINSDDMTVLRKILLGVDENNYYLMSMNVNCSDDLTVDICDLVALHKLASE